MKKAGIISIFILTLFYSLSGQKLEFGIQYVPLQASMISFDKDFIIFDDYTSQKILNQSFRLSAPSFSNSGLFIRYNLNKVSFQSGLNFQNNVYYYGRKTFDYMTSFASFYYSSIDVPATVAYTFRRNEKLKFRVLAGMNSKVFKIRRNYYSVFARRIDYFTYAEATVSEKEKRMYMTDKVNPFIVYFRSGIGIRYYNFTTDLYLDNNITKMSKSIDNYNANIIKTYQLNLAIGFSIAPKDLKSRNNREKLTKE